MAHLTLSLIGRVEIHLDERAVTFRTRKALALLACLASEDSPLSRERLLALLWSESEPTQARTGLRTALSHLRQALGESDDAPRFLVVEGDAIGLRKDAGLDLDLSAIMVAWHATRDTPAPQNLLLLLHNAGKRIRGEFMHGFALGDAPEFDHWHQAQQHLWRRRADVIFERLAQLQEQAGDVQAATTTATRWLALDATHEGAARRLMQLQFAQGDRTAALRTFESHTSTLAKQLSATPSPQTVALAERIRREAAPDLPGSVQVNMTSVVPNLTLVVPPMVGRASEFARLVAAATSAAQARPQAVVIEGEAGIGKTRLATEFMRWATARGFDVWQGRAFEAGGRVPYQAVIDALRGRMERVNAPDDLLSDVWLAELSRLLPELRERYPDLPSLPAQGEAEAQARLFEAVARFTTATAARQSLLLFLDDVQWADDASRELLSTLTRRWVEQHTPALLLMTLRAEMTSGLSSWLADLARALPVAHLRLEALAQAYVFQLAQSIAGYGDAAVPDSLTPSLDAFSQWLFDETRGQPFFMVETLKAMFERGLIEPVSGSNGRTVINVALALPGLRAAQESLGVPSGVRDVIRARLARLGSASLDVLTAAAVLGQTSDFDTLQTVSTVNENDGLRALDELLASQLLAETSNGSYLFTHDKIRDVIYADAGEARRRVFHRRALDALQRISASPAVLAHHALQAHLYQPAFRHSLAAGEAALRVFTLRDAIAQFNQALSLRDEHLRDAQNAPDAREIDRLFRQLGRAHELRSDMPTAQAVYERMLTEARALPGPLSAVMACAALNRLATLASMRSGYDKAVSLLQQAREVATHSSDTLGLAETEWNLAQFSNYHLDGANTVAHGRTALALAREIGNDELSARCLNVLSYGERALNLAHDALSHAEESSRLYAALGNRAMQVDGLAMTIDVLIECGQSREAITLGRSALEIGQRIENPWAQANAYMHLARASLDLGDYTEALEAGRHAVRTAEGTAYLPMLTRVVLGNVHRALLDLDAAHKLHTDVLAMAEQLDGPPAFHAMIAAELCADFVFMHDWAAALEQARQAIRHRGYGVLPMGHSLWPEIKALVRAGERDLAARDVDHFAASVGEFRRYRVYELRARAALAGDDAHTKLTHLREAAALAEEIGLPGELWQIYAEMGARERAMNIVQSLAERIGDAVTQKRLVEGAHREVT